MTQDLPGDLAPYLPIPPHISPYLPQEEFRIPWRKIFPRMGAANPKPKPKPKPKPSLSLSLT